LTNDFLKQAPAIAARPRKLKVHIVSLMAVVNIMDDFGKEEACDGMDGVKPGLLEFIPVPEGSK
jgi:hypothetical protein